MTNKWIQQKIGDSFEVTNGKTNTDDAVVDGAYPLFDRSTEIKHSNKYLFDTEAIIIPGEGKEFIPQYYFGKFDLHQRAYAIFSKKKNQISIKFLYYWIDYNKRYFLKMAVGSTVKSLRLYMLQNFPLSLPRYEGQKKIVEILSSIDEAIQKTDQIIQKTESLKQGLMRELLTKGIGHKKFKKTKIGDIPEEWSVSSMLESDIEIIDGDRGVNYPKQHEFYSEGFCLFLSNRNIRNDSFDFSEPIFISQEKDKQLRKGKLNRWDVILTTRGTVGNVAIYDDSIIYDHIRINSGMLIFRAGKSIAPEFLYYLLKSPLFKERYIQLGSGSAQPQLPIGSLKNLLIPILPQDEQLKIVCQLKTLDLKHYSEIKQIAILKDLKNGLMQDIFSQKVQIN
ncbi:MAG: Restriction modification system DNA specificity domain protein [Candidatus Daviesbacteria bacterium GW2011_GWB1_39_5]|uniref:Restriction modification system DNA specificity domain protein n=1 Tax=Candidatus Daviesbacteria bacterium GW2011_GWC2_40_12 TaxID=1618431 RepID=A0A0G0QZH0_9BACT|nr:MAG: Restriction modification system DNA specificity domain protein [Candidatus Daviesbacteria bacterium GW2011_GWF2_38_7]KKR17469.1 MAG: Restriction modification system DNA specificity domain protein [Candidatus Daviesbacteria bacterium GW2011_GWA2_39_33]KKR25393.1 MAG: Restriction modification system DNA specificity domain protein [Candidatus Daviesbacteria bacterium GW2011_GWB1_39_5]KKR42846.1 MAG: Restriction modification system DNA specificity domain protein [Candidatus Daviesbacteria ba